jgi:LemA protein
MSTGTMVLLALLLLIVAFILYFVAVYNSLVSLRNEIKNAWSQIDVQLKRRHDLIPNLVETVKGYASHEKGTFDEVTQARAKAAGARSMAEIEKAEGELSGVLSRFMAVAENYPELKANQNFLALQEELSSTENRISFARQAYNDQVLFLNNKVQMFPSNIVAGMFAFRPERYFELEDKVEREPVKVTFG